MKEIQPMLKTQDFCVAYQVKPITISRWVKRGVLPEPTRICGVNYWPADTKPKSDAGES